MKFSLALFISSYFLAEAFADQEQNSAEKANEYLIQKWKLWFKVFDVNKDGLVAVDDLESYKLSLKSLNNIGKKQLQVITSTIDRLWKAVVLNGNSKISEVDFVEKLKIRFETNRKRLIATLFDRDWLKVMDLNKDKLLSKEEYLIDLGYDIGPTELIDLYDYADGNVPLDDAVSSWVQFQTETDASKYDIIKVAIEHSFGG